MVDEGPRAPTWHRRLARYTRDRQVHPLVTCRVSRGYCGGLQWMTERARKSTIAAPKLSTCCSNGRVNLPTIGQGPRCPMLEERNNADAFSFGSALIRFGGMLSLMWAVLPPLRSNTLSLDDENVIFDPKFFLASSGTWEEQFLG
jgi:hypothetical protein